MIVKKHVTHEGRSVLAICDKEILGKKFEEGELQLDLTSQFYQGEEMSEEEILNILPKINSLNIVGQKSIDFAIKNKLLREENVKKIDNVPYAMCMFVEENQKSS